MNVYLKHIIVIQCQIVELQLNFTIKVKIYKNIFTCFRENENLSVKTSEFITIYRPIDRFDLSFLINIENLCKIISFIIINNHDILLISKNIVLYFLITLFIKECFIHRKQKTKN